MSDTRELLGNLPLFETLNARELEELGAVAVPRSFSRGEAIFQEGSQGEVMYVVREGRVLIKREHPSGRTIALIEMGAGDLIILVPDGLDTQVDANVGLGDITHRGGIDGTDTSGRDQSSTTIIGVPPVQVVVDAQLGLGQITIQEQ